MKIRKGFVSNSSTTSFCIYGACFDSDEIISNLSEINGEGLALIPKDKIDEFREMMNDEDADCYEVGEIIADSLGLEFHLGCESEYYYIGRSWSGVGDDETGRKFKEGIENKLKKIFSNIKFGTHEEAFRDG